MRLMTDYFTWFIPFYEHSLVSIKPNVFRDLGQATNTKGFRILEVGAGTGANFNYFPDNTLLTVVDRNPYFAEGLEVNLQKYPRIRLNKFVPGFGEDMHMLEDNSFDAVVTSNVLCSVTDIPSVLREIRRVLVPGGKYYFAEHMLDHKNPILRKIQRFLTWTGIWPCYFCGCKFRDIKTEFERAAVFPEQDVKADVGLFTNRDESHILALIRNYFYGSATKRAVN